MASVLLTLISISVGCPLDLSHHLTRVDYRPSVDPVSAGQNGPVEVRFTSSVTKINSFDTKEQTYQLNMYYRQTWVDHRLEWDNTPQYSNCTQDTLTYVDRDSIWKPDTFFSNANEIVSPGDEEYITVSRYGEVLWSRRIVITLFCTMDFYFFPYDKQHCYTSMESYSYSPEEMVFTYPLPTDKFKETITFEEGVGTVGSYTLGVPSSLISNNNIGGNLFSRIQLIWVFERAPDRSLIPFSQIWLILLSSFVGCFISLEAAPARVAISLITVLTTINLLASFEKDIPVVNHFTAMDYMYIICIGVVVGNVAEYCLINYAMTLVKINENKITELKSRRGTTGRAEEGYISENQKAMFDAEVRELFASVDIHREDCISKSELKNLVRSIAADRGRIIGDQELANMTHRVGEKVTFRETSRVLRHNLLVGMVAEPRSAILFFNIPITKTRIQHFEAIWRVWCPLLFAILNLVWFTTTLSKSYLAMYLVGVPSLTVYAIALVYTVRKRFSYPSSPFGWAEEDDQKKIQVTQKIPKSDPIWIEPTVNLKKSNGMEAIML
eukprot:TRINITY_DN2470_c0_g1_i1.p1 TRINITY_DN2470_c0_g1~~TRINITY_DN2470_c0_g1_i1.p1  ORF type:complete len:554 (+),score=34.97 TRINITY_DN2470_c0_g1_i1:44-1705(+)